MTRLIDADALLIKIDEANYTAIDIKNLIAEAPTVEQDSEPVLYWNGGNKFCTIRDINFDKRTGGTLSFGCDIPLYTSPPKREWVGLSDEVIDSLAKNGERWNEYGGWYFDADKFAKDIEAKLKEVNGYD